MAIALNYVNYSHKTKKKNKYNKIISDITPNV